MNTDRVHRLQPGYTWEEQNAFLTHFTPKLDCVILADAAGRIKFRYQLQWTTGGKIVYIHVSASFYSLRDGWQVALPPGTRPVRNGAARAAAELSNVLKQSLLNIKKMALFRGLLCLRSCVA